MDPETLQALLGAQAGAGGAPQYRPIIEFKAGKCQFVGTTVTPDKRKGKVAIVQADDGLVHFQKEDDLYVFPEDATWERVSECKTGRVYLLKFKSSPAKRFFWMQEPKEDKDEDLCTKVNDAFNNPPPLASPGAGGPGGIDPSMLGMGGGMDHNQLMALLGGGLGGDLGGLGGHSHSPPAVSGGRSGATAPTAPARGAAGAAGGAAGSRAGGAVPGSSPAEVAALQQQIMAAFGAAGGGASSSSTGEAGRAAAEKDKAPSLSNILDPDHIGPILSDPALLEALLPHLPESQRSATALRDQLGSPQMHQSLERLQHVLHSAQFSSVLAQLGVAPPASGGIGVNAFLQALEQHVAREDEKKKKEEDKKKTADAAAQKPEGGGDSAGGGGAAGSAAGSASATAADK